MLSFRLGVPRRIASRGRRRDERAQRGGGLREAERKAIGERRHEVVERGLARDAAGRGGAAQCVDGGRDGGAQRDVVRCGFGVAVHVSACRPWLTSFEIMRNPFNGKNDPLAPLGHDARETERVTG
ncbi:hypothetical protein BCEN4_770006 [Burkholderia cenocepacia]|nr:hypothetical protein BCEN4_770006 [Burkholderia cenocepacia]